MNRRSQGRWEARELQAERHRQPGTTVLRASDSVPLDGGFPAPLAFILRFLRQQPWGGPWG